MKELSVAFFVAGTAIGAGMTALPIALAQFGAIYAVLIMIGVWAIMYYSTLVGLELNLKAGKGTDMGGLSTLFGNRVTFLIGRSSLFILLYALLVVYFYGCSSIIQAFINSVFGIQISLAVVLLGYACFFCAVLLPSMRSTDFTNRTLFLIKIALFSFLVVLFLFKFSSGLGFLSDIPPLNFRSVHYVIPIIFTGFGFQHLIYSMVDFCKNDRDKLKRGFLWGSLATLVIYIIWTMTTLGIVYYYDPMFYKQLLVGKVEVGVLVEHLAHIMEWPSIRLFVWSISILSILTSTIGVGVGLVDLVGSSIKNCAQTLSSQRVRGLSILIALVPTLCAALLIPNAFINVLSFAGMILAIIAILLPLYFLRKVTPSFYPILKYKALQFFVFAFGIFVVLCELLNLIRA